MIRFPEFFCAGDKRSIFTDARYRQSVQILDGTEGLLSGVRYKQT